MVHADQIWVVAGYERLDFLSPKLTAELPALSLHDLEHPARVLFAHDHYATVRAVAEELEILEPQCMDLRRSFVEDRPPVVFGARQLLQQSLQSLLQPHIVGCHVAKAEYCNRNQTLA